MYTATASMGDSCLCNADGDFLIVPQLVSHQMEVVGWLARLPSAQQASSWHSAATTAVAFGARPALLGVLAMPAVPPDSPQT